MPEFKLEWYGKKVSGEMRNEAKRRVVRAAEHFRGKLVETLSGSRSGRTYRIPGTGRTYTASAPGQPPAVRLGRLRQSVRSVVTEEKEEVSADIGTDLDYGLYLEKGTRRMRPRPWMEPTFQQEQDTLKRIIGGDEWNL